MSHGDYPRGSQALLSVKSRVGLTTEEEADAEKRNIYLAAIVVAGLFGAGYLISSQSRGGYYPPPRRQ